MKLVQEKTNMGLDFEDPAFQFDDWVPTKREEHTCHDVPDADECTERSL